MPYKDKPIYMGTQEKYVPSTSVMLEPRSRFPRVGGLYHSGAGRSGSAPSSMTSLPLHDVTTPSLMTSLPLFDDVSATAVVPTTGDIYTIEYVAELQAFSEHLLSE